MDVHELDTEMLVNSNINESENACVKTENVMSSDSNGKDLPQRSATEIKNWLIAYLAELLEITPDEISVTVPFERYGLDSSAAVLLIGEFEDWLGVEMDPTLLYDYPTIETLAHHMELEITQTGA